MWKLCKIQMSVFINKTLLKHTPEYLFMSCLCCFHTITAVVIEERLFGPQSLTCLLSDLLLQKNFANPVPS